MLAGRTPAPEAPTSAPTAPGAPGGPQPTELCTNEAVYLEDLTVPDGTIVSPGQRLDKRWAVRNTGSCNWNAAYRLVPLGESEFSAPEAVALYPARAGEVATLQVVLDAPGSPGEYASRWQPQAPDGSLFGEPVFVFVLVEQPTPTPEPTPIPGT
jgi:hypothetical protein